MDPTPVVGLAMKTFELANGAFVEWICSGNEDRFAHAIERENAPAMAKFARVIAGEFDVDVVSVEWNEREARSFAEQLERRFEREQLFLGEPVYQWFDEAVVVSGRSGPVKIEIGGTDLFAVDEQLVHRFAAIAQLGGIVGFRIVVIGVGFWGGRRRRGLGRGRGRNELRGFGVDFRERILRFGIFWAAADNAFEFENRR